MVRSGADAIVASGVAHETVKDLECLWAQHPAFDAANTVRRRAVESGMVTANGIAIQSGLSGN